MLFGSGRVAIALAPLRQGQRFGQAAAAIPFPGSAISISAASSPSWGIHHGRSLHGLMRWLRGEQKPAAPERQAEQAVTTSTSPALGDEHQTISEQPSKQPEQAVASASAASNESNPQIVSKQTEQTAGSASIASKEVKPPWQAKKPSLPPRLPVDAPHLASIGRLEGYDSDDENIYLYFERPLHLIDPKKPLCVRLSKLYLRDTCQCNTCVSPSGLKAFATCDIPTVPQLSETDTESIRITEDGGLEITWEDDFLTRGKHISLYPLGLLRRLWAQNGRTHFHSEPERTLLDSSRFKARMGRRFISFDEWMRCGPEFNKAVFDILKYGLVFIRGVPDRPGAVRHIAERLAPVQSTLFGLTWDISSDPRRGHSTHSNEVPCLHHDLPYWNDRPKLQLLHCVQNDCHGGESLFSDGILAAWELKHKHPYSFDILCRQDISFHHIQYKRYYAASQSVIRKTKDGCPYEICWAHPFQGPFNVQRHHTLTSHDWSLPQQTRAPRLMAMSAWSKAARAFKNILEAPQNVLHHRLQPGECVIMDNRRIMNGRTAYDRSDGLRRFHGAYISNQCLNSSLIRLNERGLLQQELGDFNQEGKQAFDMLYRGPFYPPQL